MAAGSPGSSVLRDRGSSSRQKILKALDEFINHSESKYHRILAKFGWTSESLQGDDMLQCPIDRRHWVPEGSYPKHVEFCQWSKEGYSKDDYMSTHSSGFFYHNHGSVFSMNIDKQIQNEIISRANGKPTVKNVPRTPERARTDFTQAEKLAIYDHVIAEGRKLRSSSSVVVDEMISQTESAGGSRDVPRIGQKMSRLEMLKQMRDYKRRRQSYRAKNVHITKRSQTDIMREIIANQMEEAAAEWRASHGNSHPDGQEMMGQASSQREAGRDSDNKTAGDEMLSSIRRYREESGKVNQDHKSTSRRTEDKNRDVETKSKRRRSRSRSYTKDERSGSEEGEVVHHRRSSRSDQRDQREDGEEHEPRRRESSSQEERSNSSSPPLKKKRRHHSKKRKKHKHKSSKERK